MLAQKQLLGNRFSFVKKCARLDSLVVPKPLFPRFFEYDILRGLAYLVEWSKRRNKPLPRAVIAEGLERLGSYIGGDGVMLGRHVNARAGDWHGRTFPLLKSVKRVGRMSPYLSEQLNRVQQAAQEADRAGTSFTRK